MRTGFRENLSGLSKKRSVAKSEVVEAAYSMTHGFNCR